MGGRQSTGRRVQPSLPYSFHYNRLSPSPDSPLIQPLKSSPDSLTQSLLPLDHQCIEHQQQLDIQAIWGNGESLEKEIGELRSKISGLESKFHSKATNKGAGGDANFMKEVDELKHRVKKLELDSPIHPLMKKQENAIEKLKQTNTALENKIMDLTTKSATCTSNMGKQEKAIEKLKQTNTTLVNKIMELTTRVGELKSATCTFNIMGHTRDAAGAGMQLEPRIPGHEMNYLFGCIDTALIFFVCVVIGILLHMCIG